MLYHFNYVHEDCDNIRSNLSDQSFKKQWNFTGHDHPLLNKHFLYYMNVRELKS